MPKKKTGRRMPSVPSKATQKNHPPKSKRKVGRPTKYCPGLAALICTRLMGGKSLRAICADEAMPARSKVFEWLQIHTEFRDQYTHAREVQAEAMIDELLEIADDGRNDTYVDQDGKPHVSADVLGRSKLRLDTRKWIACKLLPKKYGDKLEVGGSVGHQHMTLAEWDEFRKRAKESLA